MPDRPGLYFLLGCHHTPQQLSCYMGGAATQGQDFVVFHYSNISKHTHGKSLFLRTFKKRIKLPPLPAIRSRSGLLMSHCPTRQQIFKFIVRSRLPLLLVTTESLGLLKAWRSSETLHVQGSSSSKRNFFFLHSRFTPGCLQSSP